MNETINYKGRLTGLAMISLGPVVALVLFSAVVIYLHRSGTVGASEDLIGIFQIAVPVTLVACLAAGHLFFKSRMSAIARDLPLRDKFSRYQSAYVVRMGILEAPGLLGAVAAFLTGNLYFLGATLLVVVLLLLFRPTMFNIAEDLALTPDERATIAGQ